MLWESEALAVAGMRNQNQNIWELTSRIHSAEDAVKLQSASLMDVGRELRSALNTIVASCEVLRDADIGQANKEHAGTSIAAAEGLLSVANHALQAARLEANQSKHSVDSFDAGTLADDVRAPEPPEPPAASPREHGSSIISTLSFLHRLTYPAQPLLPLSLSQLVDALGVRAAHRGLELIVDVSPKLESVVLHVRLFHSVVPPLTSHLGGVSSPPKASPQPCRSPARCPTRGARDPFASHPGCSSVPSPPPPPRAAG